MQEEWRDVKVYEGLYQVSNKGNVKSLPWPGHHKKAIIMKQSTMDSGYKQVTLYTRDSCKKKMLVHRLVADAFYSNPLHLKEVNHLDGDKGNNSVNNLEWASRSENSAHAIYVLGQKRLNNLVPLKCVETEETFESISQAARAKGISRANISAVLRGALITAGGYHWKKL